MDILCADYAQSHGHMRGKKKKINCTAHTVNAKTPYAANGQLATGNPNEAAL